MFKGLFSVRGDERSLEQLARIRNNRGMRSGSGGPARIPTDQEVKAMSKQVALYPRALDALLVTVTAISKSPNEPKFRSINSNNRIYKETIAGCGPAEEFLLMMGFVKRRATSNTFEYKLLKVNKTLLLVGKAALESEKENSPYQRAKETLVFEKALKASLESASQEEASRRQEYLSQIVPEPDANGAIGGITHIQVNLAGTYYSRRFYTDEKVIVLVQWLGTLGSIVPDKLLTGEWEVVDRSLYPPKAVEVSKSLDNTLASFGWLHSAELWVKPVHRY